MELLKKGDRVKCTYIDDQTGELREWFGTVAVDQDQLSRWVHVQWESLPFVGDLGINRLLLQRIEK